MAQKKQINLRLTEDVIKELAEIVKRYGVSQAMAISVLIHQCYIGADADDMDTWFDLLRISG